MCEPTGPLSGAECDVPPIQLRPLLGMCSSFAVCNINKAVALFGPVIEEFKAV